MLPNVSGHVTKSDETGQVGVTTGMTRTLYVPHQVRDTKYGRTGRTGSIRKRSWLDGVESG